MKVEITKKLDLVDLANDNGLRQRDIQALEEAGMQDAEFKLFCHVTDGGIEGHLQVDSGEYIDRLNEISNTLCHPFDMGGYKIMTKAILDYLETYSASYEALVDASEAYSLDLEAMREESV